MAKSPTFDVTDSEGRIIGSLRPRGTGFQFRCKFNGKRMDHTLSKIATRELAIKEARDIWQRGGASAVPLPAPIVAPAPRAENLGRALVRYLREYAKVNRLSSLQRIRPTLALFLSFAGSWKTSPAAITRKTLIGFQSKRAETVSNATVNSDMQRVKSFVNFLRVEELVAGDPTFKVRRLRTSCKAQEAISEAVAQATVEGFGDSWLADLAVVLANTGVRPQEALHVRACDVDVDNRLLRIRAYEGWEIKDAEDRALSLNDAALSVLARRKVAAGKGEALLFPSPAGKAWDYDNFAKLWRKALPASLRGKAYPYAFRHYFATQAVKAGWRLEKVSEYLGHASIETTRKHYADLRALTEVGAPPVLATERREAAQG